MTQTIDPRDFGRLEGKVDLILSSVVPQMKDHERRIGSLERSRARAYGFAGALGAVAGYLAGIFKIHS